LEGVEGGGGDGPSSGMDLFDLMTGGMGKRRRNEKRRGKDSAYPLQVTLDELYNGATRQFQLEKVVLCADCQGKGGATDMTCGACRGQGIRMIIRQLGPGMITQQQMECDRCQGEGTIIPEADRCRTCFGVRVKKITKTLEVFVTKGMSHSTKIPFKGEGDEAPNTEPGDVIIVLQQLKHQLFKREGLNLFMKKKYHTPRILVRFLVHDSSIGRSCVVGQIGRRHCLHSWSLYGDSR